MQNEGKENSFINKHDQTAQLLILPCVTGKVQKGELSTFLATVRDDGRIGSTNEMHAIGGKFWVRLPVGLPIPVPADVTAQGRDNTVLVMIPGQENGNTCC